ncbi:MAG: sigma-54 dependent transcriptional regulator [bacterium]
MRILLAEDEQHIRKGIEMFLTNEGHIVTAVEDGLKAHEEYSSKQFDLIISDMMMPNMTGLELLTKIKEQTDTMPFIMITAFASIENAVEAMKIGADDYLTKPLNLEELRIKIRKIDEKKNLLSENIKLKQKLNSLEFPEIIGTSVAIRRVKEMILKIAADPDVPVMIYGQSGTGKELAARNIHSKSNRAGCPFVAINCAALPDDLLESELFGYVKGAFTGAMKDKMGLFESANCGSLFLDEVSEMSPRLQAKLLRVLQDHKIQPLGSTQCIETNIRVLGASNVNLQELVKEGKFREDLFYRMNVIELHLPSLKERVEDIPMLLKHFLDLFQSKSNKKVKFSNQAIEAMMCYAWQGNIRELENLVRRILVTTDKDLVSLEDLPATFANEAKSLITCTGSEWENIPFQPALNGAVEMFEKEYLKYHLKKNNGNITKTADTIGLSRVSLHKKIKQYELQFDKETLAG